MLELLAPAGSMEALRAAVQNGADAIYLGFGSFNARMGARNFTPDELQEAVTYCHVRGVKVHLTLNTLAADRELPKVAEVIRAAARRGVDAFIVQDLGVLSLCREIAPEIAVHASTQMSIHSLEGVRQAAALGVSRVVLARELPKTDLAEICRRSPVEIEVFVHGAFCMCFSGQCYLSAAIGGRSGNRGQCAQPCRLPYGYGHFESRYPLSLKDNCLVSRLRELSQMGVASVKIEGRAKRPEYVATAVRVYRAALSGGTLSPQDARDLEAVFSRQGFTQGYYIGKTGPEMFGTRQETREDRALYAAARTTYETGEKPHVPVKFYAKLVKNQPFELVVEDSEGHACHAAGPLPELALHRPLTEDSLRARLQKTGGTPFYLDGCRAIVDPGLTLSAAAVNTLRRDVLAELAAVRGRTAAPVLRNPSPVFRYPAPSGAPQLTISVLRAAQITDAVLAARPAVLYVPLSEILEQPLPELPAEIELCAVLPRVVFCGEQAALRAQLEAARARGVSSVLAGNLGQLAPVQALGFRVRGDFGLNAFNTKSMTILGELGFVSALCSFEMTLPQIRDLGKAIPTELLVYGRLPLMLTQTCLVRNRAGVCACTGAPIKLVDRKGEEFPIVRDPGTCRSVLLNGKKLYLLDKQPTLRELGLWAIRLQFTTENAAEVSRVVADCQSGSPFDPAGSTRGLYLRGVD
ncbi:MAG: DUF3656 domain-containing protein [Oscillospiraceae bacterium]|nr:DUF3656 domain-containing protein [Oscillospiraceae bacterium]